jgi:arylformamidase
MSEQDLLSREYNNRELVPDHPQYFARWADGSARARATMTCYLDRDYGPAPGEKLDIFPARKGDGSVLMFIHGGYWRSLDKRDFAYLAPAWVDAGVSLVLVNYDLCPAVTVEGIVRQMLRASAWLYRHAEEYGMDEDRLFVSGWSAGAHLTAMMMAALWPVYEPQAALRVSPAFLPPATRAPLFTCVGGAESPEFKRQNALLAQRWRSAVAGDIAMPGHHHFSVVDELANPASALFAGTKRMMKLDR